MIKKLAFLLVLFTGIQTANAQQIQATVSHFSTDDGLASNAIAGIYQDDYGFIWMATWNGLSRFDGYDFYNYKTGNSSGIKNLHNRILDLAIDQSQNIWMRMYDGRVFVMNRSIDKIINPFENESGYEEFRTNYPVIVTSTGDVLVSIDGVGLYIMRLDRRGLKTELATTGGLTISCMAEGYQNDIWLGTDQGIHRLDRSNLTVETKAILEEKKILCLQSNGFTIFAGTSDGGIYSFSYGKDPEEIRRPNGNPVSSVFVDSHGLVWFGDERTGAARLDPKNGNEKLFQQRILVPEFDGRGSQFHESNGVVWIRMNIGGFGYYNREKDEVEYFHNDPSNPWNLSNTVNATLDLPEGVVWESTSRRGLEKLEILKNNIVRVRPEPNGTSALDNEIRAMYYDEKRKLLLIANKNSSLFIYNRDSVRTTITHDDQGHSFGRIYGISKDSKGNYWVCSKDYGLFKMSPKSGGGWSLKRYYHQDGDKWSMSANSAYLSLEDKDGNVWVATYGGGVNLLTKMNGREVFLHCDNEMRKYPAKSHRKIRALALDKYGNVWAGSTDGILIMSYKNRKLSIEQLQSPDDPEHILMSNDVVCITRDKEDNMWVGTMGGGIGRTIGQDQQGRWLFETYDASSGLPSEEIRSIIFDIHGNAWFGTDHIICSFDTKKKIFTTFSSLDGVDETMLSEGGSAAITMGTDQILFGTLDGYYVVDRKKLMTTTGSLLKLRITDFLINGEIQSPRLNNNYQEYPAESKSVKIPSHNSVFSFRFAALNYQLQHRVHYQYMLEGYDEDWQNAGKDRIATYSGVPGGTYRFKVKAFLLESPDKYDMRTIEVIVPSHILFSSAALWIYLLIIIIVAIILLVHYKRDIFKKLPKSPAAKRKEQVLDDSTEEYEVIEASDLEE